MRLSRALIGLLAAALLGLVPVALTTSSAQAATYATKIQASNNKSSYLHDNYIVVTGQVLRQDTNGAVPDTTGQVVLQRRLEPVASNAWKNIGSRADESVAFTFKTKAVRNAEYRLVFTGGTAAGHTYSASVIGNRTLVGRHPHAGATKIDGKPYLKGNVDPGFNYQYVHILKRTCGTCSWYVYKKVKTSGTGAYRARIQYPTTVGGEFHWKVRVPGTSPTWYKGESKVWRTYKTYGRTVIG